MIKRLALASLFMALSVVCLFIGSIWPVKIAMCVIASVITAISVLECGHKYAWLTFIGAAVISFLLIPKKSIVYAYILLLGYYPIVKLYIEKINKLIPEWIIKLVLFNIVVVIAYFAVKTFILPALDTELVLFAFKHLAFVVAAANVIFAVYDLLISYTIGFYIARIRRNT